MASEGGYVSWPGGVTVHTLTGEVVTKAYGEYVSLDELAPYQRETIGRHLDDTPRKPVHDVAESADEAREKVAESGVNLEAVPGNYGELDEEEALGVVRSLSRQPAQQAQVLVYEALHQNRQGVLDGGSKKGQEKAENLLQRIKGDSGSGAVAPPPADAEPQVPPADDGEGESEGDDGEGTETPPPADE